MNLPDDQIEVLATCLDEYHGAARSGEPIDPGVYAERLGPLYREFRGLIDTESALDRVLEPQESTDLPRNFGEYTLLQELGRGAMGIVFRARHRTLERDVAVKVLRGGFDTDETARQRFKREAKALARVAHDHIVKVHDFGEVDGIPYYTMTLVSGPSLSQLRKEGTLPDPRALCAGLAGVADALEVLHQAGVVHRDLKPSNIMMDPDTGRYLLADFGLARTATAVTMTRTGDSLGTPLYMSPEQILGKRDEVDARTDIYGLGATLYEMLVGRPPFKTDDMQELMRMVLQQRPAAPHTLDPSIPRECGNIALKCLEKRAADRYQSAADVASDLRAFLAGDRVQGKPVSSLRHRARIIRNRPLLVAASLLAVVLPAVLIYMLSSQDTRLFVKTTPQLEGVVRLNGKSYERAVVAKGIEIERNKPYEVAFEPADPRYVVPSRRVTADRDRDVDLPVYPRDLNDAEVLSQLQAQTGFDLGRVTPYSSHRGGQGDEIILVFPRGDVRRRDIQEGRVQLQVQVGESFEREGHLVFLVDDAEVARIPWGTNDVNRANTDVVRVEMPDALIPMLRDGSSVTWKYLGTKGFERSARFDVVADDLADAALQKVDALLSRAPYGADDRRAFEATLKARALAQLGLHQAAYDLVQAHLDSGGKSTLLLLEIQRLSLQELFGKQLQEIREGAQVLRAISSAPDAERVTVYGAGR